MCQLSGTGVAQYGDDLSETDSTNDRPNNAMEGWQCTGPFSNAVPTIFRTTSSFWSPYSLIPIMQNFVPWTGPIDIRFLIVVTVLVIAIIYDTSGLWLPIFKYYLNSSWTNLNYNDSPMEPVLKWNTHSTNTNIRQKPISSMQPWKAALVLIISNLDTLAITLVWVLVVRNYFDGLFGKDGRHYHGHLWWRLFIFD